MNVKATIAAGSLALALFASSNANAAMAMSHHHHRTSVEMMGHTTATLNDGTKLDVDIVKMDGHMMVAIPADELPDYLHQQIFHVMH
jgi:EAL domain-containing protein (putative c-di-GMP-specific phosphodiesterase class I)